MFATFKVVKYYKSEIAKLGKKIKKMRESKGMTQENLSDLCQVDIRTIQRLEKGEFGSGLHLIYALADAFEISVPELLT